MNFDYTDEQNAIRDSLAKWAQGQYDFDKRREALKSDDAWKKNWATFAELGLLAAPLPEDFGGLGGGPIDVSVVMEEFGKALVVEPYVATVVFGGVEVHPHRRHPNEIERPSTHARQVRQAIIDPNDVRFGMQLHRAFAHSACWFYCGDGVAAARKPCRVAAGARADIEHADPRRRNERDDARAVTFFKRHALVAFEKLRRFLFVAARAFDHSSAPPVLGKPTTWNPASTWMTSPVVERPRSEQSQSAQPAMPSIEVSSFIKDHSRPV